MNIPYGTGQLVQLVSLKKVLTVSMKQDSPLSVTNIAELAMKLTSLNDSPLGYGPVSPTSQFK